MEKVIREKKIKVIKEKIIKPKRIKKIKIQSNNVIIRYDPNKIFLDFNRLKTYSSESPPSNIGWPKENQMKAICRRSGFGWIGLRIGLFCYVILQIIIIY